MQPGNRNDCKALTAASWSYFKQNSKLRFYFSLWNQLDLFLTILYFFLASCTGFIPGIVELSHSWVGKPGVSNRVGSEETEFEELSEFSVPMLVNDFGYPHLQKLRQFKVSLDVIRCRPPDAIRNSCILHDCTECLPIPSIGRDLYCQWVYSVIDAQLWIVISRYVQIKFN